MTDREQFEAWGIEQGFAIRFPNRIFGMACEHTADMAWKCWQASRKQALQDGFAIGWTEGADWADRDDLIADIGSPAYLKDRDAALASEGGE